MLLGKGCAILRHVSQCRQDAGMVSLAVDIDFISSVPADLRNRIRQILNQLGRRP